jgi:uncharacterized membrane protein YwzB
MVSKIEIIHTSDKYMAQGNQSQHGFTMPGITILLITAMSNFKKN